MKKVLFFFAILTVSFSGAYAQYVGGDNDGSGSALDCAINLNGGSVFIPGPIVGSSTFCDFATEVYTITVGGSTPSTVYNWSVPVGATITSGQGTNTILVTFGNTGGNVSIDVSNECELITVSLPVGTTSCVFYSGGNNDGFSNTQQCASNLNGGATFLPGPIVGSVNFCDFATEVYTISVAGALSNTVYTWSVPPGATITSGQGTNTILVTFGNTGGNVSVDVSNECETINVFLPVTTSSCIFYAGGNNDGFSNTQQCASNLNGGSTFLPGPIVGSVNFCDFATEVYTISVAGALSNTVYFWSVPPGAGITSGQGTNTILVTFGNTGGNVSVDISNECETINVFLPVSTTSCIFYAGGNNDGFSNTQECASNLNGGSTFIPGPIAGSTNFCDFATEVYTINVAGALSNTVYFWSVPPGATVTSGQGTNTILVTFGNTGGNVSVDVSNQCETINVSLAVSTTSCIFYAGGSNDGFSTFRVCATNLNGGSALIPGPIIGSTSFCAFATEAYSITVAGATPTTTYIWSGPAGSSVASGQGTSSVLISFGNTSGNVNVDISNECGTINVQLAVGIASCIFYAGGSNDGFSVTVATNIPLPIELVSFDATVVNGVVYLEWLTDSEIDNDFFLIERSKNGRKFEQVVNVNGAGTSHERIKYQATDSNPFKGTSYYRLSQTDYDGTITYSRVLSVKVEDLFYEVVKLYPNPVTKGSQLHIDFYSESDEKVRISVVDPSGTSAHSDLVQASAGMNTFDFTPDFQTSGVYVVIIRTTTKSQIFRVVVL